MSAVQPPPPAAAGAEAARERAVGRIPRTAVIVCHGMGQQVRFETLNPVATRLAMAEQHQRGRDAAPGVRVVKLEPSEVRLPRVELSLSTATGEVREVHLYEAYWAPLTEGQIRDRDVAGFMLTAGSNGLRRGVRTFRRLTFGAIQEFKMGIPAAVGTWLSFLAAFVVFVSLIVIQVVVSAIAGARVAFGALSGAAAPAGAGQTSSSGWLNDALMGDLTADLLLVVVPVALLLFATLGPGSLRKAAKERDFWTPWRINRILLGLCWTLIVVALAATVTLAGFMLVHVALHQAGSAASVVGQAGPAAPTMWWDRWFGFNWQWIRTWNGSWGPSVGKALDVAELTLVWGAAYWASHKARWFFRQYMGDVAIYVTPQTLDRFWQVRQAIKDCAVRVGSAAYGATEGAAGTHLYGRLVVVGHSLGSVVAYDMLDELLKEDAVSDWPLQIAARTPLFLTFGSPLDKIAYVFGTQRPAADVMAHALAAAVQPLVTGYDDRRRPARWVNLHSSNDWISGDLNYFDTADPGATPPAFQSKRVDNQVDPEATTPLLAHNEYWDNLLFTQRLYDALTT